MNRQWPNLRLRARIERRTKSARIAEVARTLGSLVHLDEDDEEELETLAAHVKTCPDCKAMLAKEARSGVYIPDKLLVAAGIEVLRN